MRILFNLAEAHVAAIAAEKIKLLAKKKSNLANRMFSLRTDSRETGTMAEILDRE